MARLDVYRSESGFGYLLDVQSDILGDLNTRVVVPLLPRGKAPSPAQGLNPVLEVERTEVVMTTQFMAAVPATELKKTICRMEEARDEISAALDILFLGF